MFRFVVVVSLFALTTLVAGCPGPDWPKCESDDHCQEKDGQAVNYVCVFGQCQECGRDADCKDGKKCKANRCQAPCVADSQCGNGMSCDKKTGDCVKAAPKPAEKPKGGEGASCVETGDCQKGFVCEAQKCTDPNKAKPAEPVASAKCEPNGRVYFDFNVYDLTPEARTSLDDLAKCMGENAGASLTIEGHADERGTTQYNLDLGEKRARAVEDYLVRLGVTKGRIRTVSYGEEQPLEASSSEGAWAKNRRGELKLKLN